MQKFYWLWPAIIVGSIFAVLWLTLIMPGTALQPLVVMWFLFVCPGMAWTRLLNLNNILIELTLGVALGIALDAIIVGFFLYGHFWSPPAMLIVICAITLIGVSLQAVQYYRSLPRFEAIYGNTREANSGSAFSPEASLEQASSNQR